MAEEKKSSWKEFYYNVLDDDTQTHKGALAVAQSIQAAGADGISPEEVSLRVGGTALSTLIATGGNPYATVAATGLSLYQSVRDRNRVKKELRKARMAQITQVKQLFKKQEAGARSQLRSSRDRLRVGQLTTSIATGASQFDRAFGEGTTRSTDAAARAYRTSSQAALRETLSTVDRSVDAITAQLNFLRSAGKGLARLSGDSGDVDIAKSKIEEFASLSEGLYA